jgi:filamentous hemagglutinin family protein
MKLSRCIGKASDPNCLPIGVVILLSLFPYHPLQAQVIQDTTPVNSLVRTNGNTFTIDGGTTAGSNLFHSFSQFSIPTGSEAFFNNTLDVQNIISRVTGGSISNIDGSIRANGSANLFLLNPNGIVFGPNASLNIGGSFLGSTANAINFADGKTFSAKNLQGSPLLTVSVPVGLGFGSNPGSIQVQGKGQNLSEPNPVFPRIDRSSVLTGLRVQPGHTLALVGGNVTLEGGLLTAEGGRVELGSVGSGSIGLTPTTLGWTFNYKNVQRFRDIQLSSQALIDASDAVTGIGGGSIYLQGANVSVTDGSFILIQNQGEAAGSIKVNASSSLQVSGTSPNGQVASRLVNQTIGAGKGGDIELSTQRLVVRDGGFISARTLNGARGGDVRVNASNSVQVAGFSAVNPNQLSFISTAPYSSGNAGNVTVSTGQLTVLDGGAVISTTFGAGSAGNVSVDATQFVQVVGAVPNSLAPSLVSSTTLYNGSDRDQGSAGNVTVNTPQLVVRDGGRVGSSTLASGRAGNIIINASDVKVSGRFPGSINSSLIDSSGNIVDEFLRQVLGLPDAPSGDSGSVTINANRLSVTDGALVTVRNDGTGAAGTLTVNARSILLDNKGAITAVSGESGERENEASITLNVRDALILRRNSQISAEATRGEQRGGNITINAGAIAAVPRENSDITASAPQGTGGTITINAQAIFGLQVSPTLTPTKSEITAFGKTPELNGTVQINTPEINLQGALNQLNGNFVTPEQAIASSCLARRNAQQGSFTVTGTGGLPYTPYDAVRGQYAVSSVQGLGGQEGQGGISSATVSLPSPQASNPKSWKLGDPIQEAQGMTQTADGRLIVGTASELVRVAQAKDIICDTDERSTPQ